MSAKTRQQLYSDFSNNQTATGEKFADLIDSFKMIQAAVSDPAASGTSVTFIATIEQNTEGVITVTKKTVNFSGYQTVAGMSAYQTVSGMGSYQTIAGMSNYQNEDIQVIGGITVDGSGNPIDVTVNHGKKHFPTVRVVDGSGFEMRPRPGLEEPYIVQQVDNENLKITINGMLNVVGASYKYILD